MDSSATSYCQSLNFIVHWFRESHIEPHYFIVTSRNYPFVGTGIGIRIGCVICQGIG
jgi:hypothetical protein